MKIEEAKSIIRHARHRHALNKVVGIDQLIEAAHVLSSANCKTYRICGDEGELIITANRRPTHKEVRELTHLNVNIEIHEWNANHWRLP